MHCWNGFLDSHAYPTADFNTAFRPGNQKLPLVSESSRSIWEFLNFAIFSTVHGLIALSPHTDVLPLGPIQFAGSAWDHAKEKAGSTRRAFSFHAPTYRQPGVHGQSFRGIPLLNINRIHQEEANRAGERAGEEGIGCEARILVPIPPYIAITSSVGGDEGVRIAWLTSVLADNRSSWGRGDSGKRSEAVTNRTVAGHTHISSLAIRVGIAGTES